MQNKSRMADWGFWAALLCAVVLGIAVLALRTEVIGFGSGGAYLLGVGFVLGLLGLVLSVLGLMITMAGKSAGRGRAALGALVSLAVLGVPAYALLSGSDAPQIHDITTDLADPPQFVEVVELRGARSNPLDRAKPADLAELQRAAYPDLAPISVSDAPDVAFDRALAVAEQAGWTIVSADKDAGRIEATCTTAIMRYKDDVVIRVRPGNGGGSTVDLRSVSRVGVSDLGQNAERIRTFIAAFQSTSG